jgi:O-succinylbenzoate synthase
LIISSVELREIRLPLVHFFETSFGRTTERRIVLVRVIDNQDGEGWGECTAGEEPLYSEEWTESAWAVLNEFLVPLILNHEFETAAEVWKLLRPIRGNRMAKAALENACWDLEAKRKGVPLWRLLGGTNEEIPCGVSIGIQDTPGVLLDKIAREVAAGYQRIKIKIKPGWDLSIVELVRREFPDILLTADANSAYSLADVQLFRDLDRFNLMMVEQPLSHTDIFDHAQLQQAINTPLCLDESIRSPEDAQHAIALKACRIINVKLGRVGGHEQARRVEQVAREKAIPVWCGGMLESGIGRAHNIAMSTLSGFVLPGDVSASARYWTEDIIEPEVVVSAKGTIVPSAEPGIGHQVRVDRLDQITFRNARHVT